MQFISKRHEKLSTKTKDNSKELKELKELRLKLQQDKIKYYKKIKELEKNKENNWIEEEWINEYFKEKDIEINEKDIKEFKEYEELSKKIINKKEHLKKVLGINDIEEKYLINKEWLNTGEQKLILRKPFNEKELKEFINNNKNEIGILKINIEYIKFNKIEISLLKFINKNYFNKRLNDLKNFLIYKDDSLNGTNLFYNILWNGKIYYNNNLIGYLNSIEWHPETLY